jgi:hypothetical protein
MIHILVETYLYESCNYIAPNGLPLCPSENLYIVTPNPSCLHPYNHGFDRKDPHTRMVAVDCCPDLGCCIGNIGYGDESQHAFLLADEGVDCSCCSCSKQLCQICSLEHKEEEDQEENECEKYCVGCYAEARCFPKQNNT